MNYINELDKQIFLYINHLPHNDFINNIALFLTGIGTFGFIWFIIVFYIYSRAKKQGKLIFLPLMTAVALSALAADYIFKPLFGRLRPTELIGTLIIDTFFIGPYSFPSGHTAASFAGAGILSFFEKKYALWFFLIAFLISLSRIYLGKHYPTDLFAGMIVGLICAFLALLAYKPSLKNRKKSRLV